MNQISAADNRDSEIELAEVIPSKLAITAMRDSGYKNTAYALAELIDNAQQANADSIEVFCFQRREKVRERERSRISRIAVLDNGEGMSADTLRKALQFGNGTRLGDRTGIGRFGMGLPNASISQACRVDVWSWQNGTANALHSYLDVREIESGAMRHVPEPKHSAPPSDILALSGNTSKSGTLVVWSDVDINRLTWKSAKSTLLNTERVVGRVYRRFIADGTVVIRLVAHDEDTGIVSDNEATIDDPLYLIPSPRLPAPFSTMPMFDLVNEHPQEIEYDGQVHTVTVRYSVAKQDTVDQAGTQDRGNTAYGQHAKTNIGVSVIRAGRELMLDQGWCIGYDPRERWWGAEVEFPPALDELFGVTNNKQAATHFAELATIDWQQLADEGEEFRDVVNRLKDDGDPRGWLLSLSDSIKRNLEGLREIIRSQGKGARSTRRERHSQPDELTSTVNQSWKDRAKDRPVEGEANAPSEGDLKNIKDDLTANKKYTEAEAAAIVSLIKDADLRVVFLEADFPDDYHLFNVELKGNVTEITFNRRHPAFDAIFGTINTIDEDVNSLNREELLDRLMHAVNATKIIFAGWARLEREAGLDRAKQLGKIRFEWGQIASEFLQPTDSSS